MSMCVRKPTNLSSDQVLHRHRRWLEVGNFGFRKKRNCTIRVAKTKGLISFAVTAKLICAFVFANADCWFSYAAVQISFFLIKHVLEFQNKFLQSDSGHFTQFQLCLTN